MTLTREQLRLQAQLSTELKNHVITSGHQKPDPDCPQCRNLIEQRQEVVSPSFVKEGLGVI